MSTQSIIGLQELIMKTLIKILDNTYICVIILACFAY
jgi:hypothetical protein